MALISCKNLKLGYDGREIADNISFEVNEGDYLCIIGENGSGKSTLMKTVLGLLKPVSGEIEFGEGLKQTEIGYIPQQTVIQKDFPASIKEVVLSGTLNNSKFKPFYTARDRVTAKRNMEILGLLDMQNKCYHDLSGGQQQRVLLARALCATKKVLVLDEPVAGLDPVVTNELYEIINKLNKKHGITIIMISHDVSAITKDASHILHLYHKPLFFGKTSDYMKTKYAKAFLGRGEDNDTSRNVFRSIIGKNNR